MTALKALSVAVGAVVVAADLLDLVRALIVPRPQVGGPVAAASRTMRRGYAWVARRIGDEARRDGLLALGEPVVLLARMAIWLTVGLVGFALITWGTGRTPFGQAFVEAGSSVFTLGIAAEHRAGPEVVAFLAAAFGLTVVALQIAYLPALYDAFNRRETLVTLLESRAGTPAWGPELLARHYLVGIEGNLPALYADWERWAADVAESHSTYPVLLWLRSPHRENSWLVGLAAVLDSAALVLAFNPGAAPPEARLCVRMGFTALRDLARVTGVPFDPDPRPDDPVALTFGEFAEAAARMARAGVPLERSPEEAWPHFRGWRVNYESIVYALARRVYAPPAPWTGPRDLETAVPRPLRPVDRRPGVPEGDPGEAA